MRLQGRGCEITRVGEGLQGRGEGLQGRGEGSQGRWEELQGRREDLQGRGEGLQGRECGRLAFSFTSMALFHSTVMSSSIASNSETEKEHLGGGRHASSHCPLAWGRGYSSTYLDMGFANVRAGTQTRRATTV